MVKSVYISKQYEFVDKILKLRKRKRIKTSFFLSIIFHIFLFIFLSLSFKTSNIEKNIVITETYVNFADYKPMERTLVDKMEKSEEKVVDETEVNTRKEKESKINDKEKINIFKRPGSFNWRENVSKKYIREDAKIVTPKLKDFSAKDNKQMQSNDLSPQMVGYVKALILTIKSHWQIPEDVYNKLQGYSSELEIYIDENGYLKYKVIKPANSKIFNEYSEEALKKTFTNLPPQLLPPKEFIDYIKNGGKIVIEFKL